MPIVGSTLKAGTTAVSVTGGSDITFALTGQAVAHGLNVSVVEDADYRTRRNCTFKSMVPSITNGVYSRGRNSVAFVKPIVLDDGSTVFNNVRVFLEVHPALAASDVMDLRRIAAQLISSPTYDSFWSLGALA